MSELFVQLKQMGICVVIAGLILYLSPSKEYERYIRLLLVIILTVYIGMPVISFFTPDGQARFQQQSEYFYQEIIQKSISEAGDTKSFAEELEERVNNEWIHWGSSYISGNGIGEE